MNERIKELQFQAAAQVNPLLEGSEWQQVFVENFAELIVRDFVAICETEKADYIKNRKAAYDFEEKQIYAEGEAACDTLKYKAKHRFGVKR